MDYWSKLPLGTFFLMGLALLSCPFLRCAGVSWRDESILLAPGLAVLGFVSSQTGFNHHVRYVLPALPFLFIWIGRVAIYRGRLRRLWWAAVLTAFLATAVSSLRVYPHSMSYFNELVGGPMNGSAQLLQSNLDWGQDLLFLKAWYDAHPEARPFHLVYYGYIDPRVAGLEFTLPPKGIFSSSGFSSPNTVESRPQPGWHAVSACFLQGYRYLVPDGQGGLEDTGQPYFAYFSRFRPIATAGYSIWIYHLNTEECNRVRAELGLPGLSSGH